MVEILPKNLPDLITVSGKNFRRVGPDQAHQWGITRSTAEGYRKWHYYLSEKAYTSASIGGSSVNPGLKRHFTVYVGTGGKGTSVHLSLKAHDGKRGEGSYWFTYDTQAYSHSNNWHHIPNKRTTRAEVLIADFVSVMTASGAKPTVKSPPFVSKVWDGALPEAIEEDPWVGESNTPTSGATGGSSVGPAFDDWEEYLS